MPRSRRAWSTMRDSDIRVLLRETVAATSFWSDAQLLLLFNAAMDLRVMQAAMVDEGWMTDQYTSGLVADQREYPLPEGAGRVKRVSLKWTDGSVTRETPLDRNDQWGQNVTHVAGSPGSISSYHPTYQLQANLILLEPSPGFTRAASLMIDLESAPARLSADADKLDLRWPDVAETLLIYDTVILALAMEHSQGGTEADYVNHLRGFQREFESAFMEYITDRTEGRTFGQPFNQGA